MVTNNTVVKYDHSQKKRNTGNNGVDNKDKKMDLLQAYQDCQ